MRVSSDAMVRLGVPARKRALDSVKALGAEKIASANAKATTTEAVNRRHLCPMTSTPLRVASRVWKGYTAWAARRAIDAESGSNATTRGLRTDVELAG